MESFAAVKVFSATMARERETLGERVSEWLRTHPELRLVDRVLTQSSDNEYHCLTIMLFLAGDAGPYLADALPSFRPPAPRPTR